LIFNFFYKPIFFCHLATSSQALLFEAETVWGRYRKDERLECRSLMSAGRWAEAHSLFVASVGPALFLAGGRHSELSELVEGLAQGCSGHALHHVIPTSDWFAGGGLFRNFLAYSQHQVQGSDGVEDLLSTLLRQLQSAGERLSSAMGASLDAATRRPLLRRQLAFSQMAQAVHGGVMGRPLAPDGSDAALRMGAMAGLLSLGCLPPEPRMAGVATAAAAVTRILV
jgi:nuclear pore complex protein Nup98-Nup96